MAHVAPFVARTTKIVHTLPNLALSLAFHQHHLITHVHTVIHVQKRHQSHLVVVSCVVGAVFAAVRLHSATNVQGVTEGHEITCKTSGEDIMCFVVEVPMFFLN